MNTKEYENLARQYENLSVDELEEEFRKQLALAEIGIGAATRGKDFWENARKEIISGLLKNSDLISATLGMISSEVITYLASAGIDLIRYRLLIAVFIMIVAKAYWKALEKHLKKSGKK